jgi:PAS domain S-box-containing protein
MHQSQLHPPRMEEFSRETFKEHAKKTKQKESIHPFENLVLRPDGIEVPVEVLGQMVTIKGKPVLQGVFRDITDRKNAEKRLEASFKRFEEEKAKTESIIAAIGDAISIQDTVFKIIYQNKIHQDIMGDQTGKYCYKEYEHRDHICEGCPVNMSFKDGKIHTEERSLIRNKKELYYEITASPLRDSTGNIIAGIEVARDITERKQTEAAILEREERLYQAVRVSQIGIFDHDHRTDTIYWSPGQRHIYGWGPDEHRIIDRNGSIHWVSTRSRTRFEGEGSSRRPVRTIGTTSDITERKSAEEVLKRYQLLSQKTRDIILFIRVSDGQIIEANQAAVQACGY